MKKNIINKLLLITPLVFGLIGCKGKPSSDEFITRPKPVTIVREATNEELFTAITKIQENKKRTVSIQQKLLLTQKDPTSEAYIKIKGGATVKLYKNASYDVNLEINFENVSDFGIKYPTQTLIQKQTNAWKDGKMFTTSMQSFVEEQNIFNIMEMEEEDLPEYPLILDDIIDIGVFLDSPLFIDTEGNYHFIQEMYSYQVVPFGSQFYHEVVDLYMDVVLNKNLELVRSYGEETIKRSKFNDDKKRAKNELDTIMQEIIDTNIKYGEPPAMPNLDEFIANFPKTYIQSLTSIRMVCSPAAYNSSNELVVDTETVIWAAQNYIQAETTSTGGAKGDYLSTDAGLKRFEAISFELEYTAARFNEDCSLETFSHSEPINLEEGIAEHLSDDVKVVQVGDSYFLVYAPTEDGAPNIISASIAFDYKINPLESEMFPLGEVEISNILVRRYIL